LTSERAEYTWQADLFDAIMVMYGLLKVLLTARIIAMLLTVSPNPLNGAQMRIRLTFDGWNVS